jgi:hypothetical protein
MNSDRIERRLRRLDAAVLRTEQHIEMLSVARDRYDNVVAGAIISAEVSREQFITAAQIAFRDPYRALKAWERREWRLTNLAPEAPDEADVPGQIQAAILNGKSGAGLSLRGRKRFGRDNADRVAAHEALSNLGTARAEWLRSLRRAQTFSYAVDRVGRQIGQLKNRLRNTGLRRAELLERLYELKMPQRGETKPEPTEQGPQTNRASLSVPELVDTGVALDNARRRRARLDRAAVRYEDRYELLKDAPVSPDGKRPPNLRFIERRLSGYRLRRSELTATIVRAQKRLPEGLQLTGDDLADLKELHRAYRMFVEERIKDARYPPDMPVGEREQLDRMAHRAERLEKGIARYRYRIAELSDPEFDIPEKGNPGSGYRMSDSGQRDAALASLRRRLTRAELRHRALRESLAAQRVLSHSPGSRGIHWERELAQEEDREKRAEKERRRLARLHLKERDRADDLEPEL